MKKTLTFSISLFFFFVCFTFVFSPNANALLVYQGSLETPDGISGTGDWATNFKISWVIEEQNNALWKYIYTLTTQSGASQIASSHLNLEISNNATSNDFSGFNGSPVEFGVINDAGQGQPGPFNGIKLDYESAIYSFFSTRSPVWGDFFVKDGTAKNTTGKNTAWNADFFDADPTTPPQDGLLSDGTGGSIYKLLRPDTVAGGTSTPPTNIPEPMTTALLGTGLLGLFFSRRNNLKSISIS